MTEKKPVAKPGNTLMILGAAALVLGVVILIMNLTSTQVNYVAGLGTVETRGTPSVGSIVLLIAGVVLAVVGFAKRLVAAAENR
jgi:amino acid transporter